MAELIERSVRFADVDSRAIVTDGDASAPSFLLLHGFSDSADGWRRLQRRLGDAGHRTMAVDQPSHGRAGLIRSDEPVIPQFVAFAAEAAAGFRSDGPLIVIGNSLGGAHALLLAQHHPAAVDGVVAISPASFHHPGWLGRPDGRVVAMLRDQRLSALDDVTSRRRRIPRGPELVVRRRIAETALRTVAFGAPWRAPGGFVRDMTRQFGDPGRLRALLELGLRIPDEYIAVHPIDLPSIDTPVLALWGSLDRLVRISSRRILERGLPDLTFVALRGIGHMPQLEAPGRTAKHVLAFADRVAAPRAVAS